MDIVMVQPSAPLDTQKVPAPAETDTEQGLTEARIVVEKVQMPTEIDTGRAETQIGVEKVETATQVNVEKVETTTQADIERAEVAAGEMRYSQRTRDLLAKVRHLLDNPELRNALPTPSQPDTNYRLESNSLHQPAPAPAALRYVKFPMARIYSLLSA